MRLILITGGKMPKRFKRKGNRSVRGKEIRQNRPNWRRIGKHQWEKVR